jgi:hypothetical protein
MGLFSKIKKAFKKITGAVKKVVKKVVKGVKKVVKKIGSSKILKALATAAAVVVTGGAAIGAFTGGAGVAGATKLGKFANWAMNASKTVSSGSLFGKAAGKKGVAKFLTQAGNFATKTVAKPFTSLGSSAGNIARGVTDFTGLTDASTKGLIQDPTQAKAVLKNSGLTPEQINSFSTAELEGAAQAYVDTKGGVGTFTMADLDAARATTNTTVVSASPKPGFWQSGAGKFVADVGTGVAKSVATGAAMQYIEGDPEQRGSMSGAAYEGAEFMDPLKVYAAQQGINTDGIYQHMMYGNADPSTQYGNELYRQQTFGVA